jgi:hypothetical protein
MAQRVTVFISRLHREKATENGKDEEWSEGPPEIQEEAARMNEKETERFEGSLGQRRGPECFHKRCLYLNPIDHERLRWTKILGHNMV